MAVSVSLADDIDISRGDLIARPNNQPRVAQDFDATVCWMADEAALEPGRDYIIKHTTRTTRVKVDRARLPARRQHAAPRQDAPPR